jgi:hypothetical protein
MPLRLTPGLLLVALALAPLSSGATPARTPDQQLVSQLETATAASRAALRSLARPSARSNAKATEDLQRALTALDVARKVAPRAVGALKEASMRAALQQAYALTRQARSDIAKRRYDAARVRIKRVVLLKTVALTGFGAPLLREFTSFAVNRNFRNAPSYTDYSGLTATAAEEVVEIVIGLADRATATAGLASASTRTSAGLPITQMTAYQIQDPIGAYSTNWCTLDAGLISCVLSPTLRPRHKFTLAFTPKLERGTEILVKFRSASGKRSYAVFETR